jgi:anti-anti-sigma regulatory factor
MTGAAIVRWESEGTLVLAIHGSFDGASAWALRNEMDEAAAHDFVVDLTHAVEALDFAASLLAGWARLHRREKRLRFRSDEPAHVRLLARWGLEVIDSSVDAAMLPSGFGPARSPGASA